MGSDVFRHEIAAAAVIKYALSRAEVEDDNTIYELAGEDESDLDGIDHIIKVLAQKERSNYPDEWQVVYVAKSLPQSTIDCISGLIALGDIWARLGFPAESPHIFQGKGNSLAPEDYYTQENYLELLRKHRNWIVSEINCLKSREGG